MKYQEEFRVTIITKSNNPNYKGNDVRIGLSKTSSEYGPMDASIELHITMEEAKQLRFGDEFILSLESK